MTKNLKHDYQKTIWIEKTHEFLPRINHPNDRSKMMILRAIQFLYSLGLRAWINLNFSLAGVRGRRVFRLPGGITLDSNWLLKVGLLLIVGGIFRAYMNELLQAAAQFCPTVGGGITGTGGGGGLPGPYGGSPILPIFPQNQGNEDTGMHLYRAPSPGVRVEVFEIPETPVSHSNASHSRAGEAEEAAGYRRIGDWKPDYGRFRPSEPEACDPVFVDEWKRGILKVLQKECRPPFYITRSQWGAALDRLHQGRGHFVWFDNLNALRREGEGCPFFQQLVEEVKRLKFCR